MAGNVFDMLVRKLKPTIFLPEKRKKQKWEKEGRVERKTGRYEQRMEK